MLDRDWYSFGKDYKKWSIKSVQFAMTKKNKIVQKKLYKSREKL
jgi:hypothetical protein